MKRTSIAFTLGVLWCAAALAAEQFTGQCVGVTDGDTISVMRDGRAAKTRLWGIDCPESGQAFGKQVTVSVRDRDRYGRAVGVVILPDERKLNCLLVQEGLAWWYRKYAPRAPVIEELEARAKEAKRGLWADKNPIPPWDFRKRPSVSKVGTGDETVYVTMSGRKYHADGCRHLRSSKIAMRLSGAKGYFPCATCKPPVMARSKTESTTRSSSTGGGTVYVTDTGKKYHKGSCHHLRQSKHAIALADAKAQDYGPCSRCRPPR